MTAQRRERERWMEWVKGCHAAGKGGSALWRLFRGWVEKHALLAHNQRASHLMEMPQADRHENMCR